MLGGNNVQGVISHDVTLPNTHPGYNEHHQIHGTLAPAPLEPHGWSLVMFER
jgi:hypothetical protein